MLKKITLIATLIYTIALTIVSLIKLNNLPDIGVSFADKVFHFLAYCLLTFLWYGTFLQSFKFKIKQAIYSAVILSIIFGIIIEVLQGTITVARAMDVFDIAANTLGTLLVAIALWFKNSLHVKNT